ncbi:MAG: hypothetical protein ABIH41_00305, partial [Nanoarchaeota archaeon]
MEKKLERILVIEDNAQHLRDAQAFFDSIPGLTTDYACILEQVIPMSTDDNPLYKVEHFKDESGSYQTRYVPLVDGVVTD